MLADFVVRSAILGRGLRGGRRHENDGTEENGK
jgi:hypothetical protein